MYFLTHADCCAETSAWVTLSSTFQAGCNCRRCQTETWFQILTFLWALSLTYRHNVTVWGASVSSELAFAHIYRASFHFYAFTFWRQTSASRDFQYLTSSPWRARHTELLAFFKEWPSRHLRPVLSKLTPSKLTRFSITTWIFRHFPAVTCTFIKRQHL